MLKNSNVEVVYSILRYTPDVGALSIKVEIATGSIVDGKFVSDGRELIKHSITNIADKSTQKIEPLTVNASGQVTLSLIPIDNNPIEVNGIAQAYPTGQIVECSGYSENDIVEISYYHTVAGRNWFDEAASFVKEDHPEYAGLTDYQYNAKRLWSILIEMGLVSGVTI